MSRRTEMLFHTHTLAIENEVFMQFIEGYFSQEEISLMIDINSGCWKNIPILYNVWDDSLNNHNGEENTLYNEVNRVRADICQERMYQSYVQEIQT
jgi:hypothetical protein